MRKFLGKETRILGFLPEDPAVHKAVHAQKPFLTSLSSCTDFKKDVGDCGRVYGREQAEGDWQGEGFLGKLTKYFYERAWMIWIQAIERKCL